MNDIVGKALSLIIVHIAGFVVFYALWYFIVVPLFDFPMLGIRDMVTLYLIIDILFFILAKFDNQMNNAIMIVKIGADVIIIT